jgi:hypothetical protein
MGVKGGGHMGNSTASSTSLQRVALAAPNSGCRAMPTMAVAAGPRGRIPCGRAAGVTDRGGCQGGQAIG